MRLQNRLYLEDLEYCASLDVDWSAFGGKTIVVSGATGMIGTFLIDTLMHRCSSIEGFECKVIALGRNRERAKERFPYFNDSRFEFVETDVSIPGRAVSAEADLCFHLASTTHPVAYATDPLGTIDSNIYGLSNLSSAVSGAEPRRDGSRRMPNFVFASSVEIYGESRGDVEAFSEDYCGYINCNTLRAGYPESKRTCEALCQAYLSLGLLGPVIPRLPRTYGPTMLQSDTKALSQFIKNAVDGHDIVLKSEGNQFYSFLYVADVVAGMLWCLTKGKTGEAYNIADAESDITLRDLAELVAGLGGASVVFDLPDEAERAGYSSATVAIMDASKLNGLGWHPQYPIASGLDRTIKMLKDGL